MQTIRNKSNSEKIYHIQVQNELIYTFIQSNKQKGKPVLLLRARYYRSK